MKSLENSDTNKKIKITQSPHVLFLKYTYVHTLKNVIVLSTLYKMYYMHSMFSPHFSPFMNISLCHEIFLKKIIFKGLLCILTALLGIQTGCSKNCSFFCSYS